jgi:hypothetical protein
MLIPLMAIFKTPLRASACPMAAHVQWNWVARLVQRTCLHDSEATMAEAIGDENTSATARHGAI